MDGRKNRQVKLTAWAAFALLGAALALTPPRAQAARKGGHLKVTVSKVKRGGPIPTEYSFCVPAEKGHVTLGPNKNPEISWSKGPKGTRSYAIIMYDPDVPTVATNVNKEGKTIPAGMRRTTFYHWILVNIPANVTSIAEGSDSNGVTPKGKTPGASADGLRGVNDYTNWFASDPNMKGEYGGYDGPCPPWNDQRVHHYHFAVYALDVADLDLSGNFDGKAAKKAMKGHILAKGQTVGTYALNPKLRKRLHMDQ